MRAAKNLLKRVPLIRSLVNKIRLTAEERAELARLRLSEDELDRLKRMVGPFRPGHYYSPIPDLDQVRLDEAQIWPQPPGEIDGVDLNDKGQLETFDALRAFYAEIPFPAVKSPQYRYYFENPFYAYADAVALYGMIRHARPEHIIEIGSGHTSCLILDTNELFFHDSISTTFIEPFPERLYSLIRSDDLRRIRVLPTRLQDLSLSEFDVLGKNDILFIDSTHVSKINSDVNHIFFQILPRLKSGVYIHFHDMFYPFEYPPEWVYQGRAWNEAYMMRAFLECNQVFKIIYFNSYLVHFYENLFRQHMPLCLKDQGGCLWLQKL